MNKLIISVALSAALASGSALAMNQGDAAAGKTKSAACAGCHGADGNSPAGSGFPRLAGQYADYIVQALKEYKSGGRNNPIMAGMVAGLKDDDMHDLAAYFASQSGLETLKPE